MSLLWLILRRSEASCPSQIRSVPYRALTGTFDLIQNTTKRLEIARYLTRFLIDVIELTPGDLLKTVYLCINRVSFVLRLLRHSTELLMICPYTSSAPTTSLLSSALASRSSRKPSQKVLAAKLRK